MKQGGIYKITSLINAKFYIGSAVNFKSRFSSHRWDLKQGNHHNIKLQRHFNKHGINILNFEIIEIVINEEDLVPREQFYLDTLNPIFNICKIAGSCLGRKVSDKTRDLIKKANIGRVPWNKGKKGIYVGWNKGKKASAETREKLRQAQLGHVPSEETRQKLREAYNEKSSRKGSVLSEDHKKAISEFNKQNHNDGMFKKGQISLNKGRKHSEETKEKLRKANLGHIPWCKGKKLLNESIEKRTETRRKNNELKKLLNPPLPKIKKINIANFKLVINLETGIYYDSAKEAGKNINYTYASFARMLNGGRVNKTNFIYA